MTEEVNVEEVGKRQVKPKASTRKKAIPSKKKHQVITRIENAYVATRYITGEVGDTIELTEYEASILKEHIT